MKHIIKWMQNHKYVINAILFILAFIVPLLLEKIPTKYNIPPLVVGIAIVWILEIIITYEEYATQKENTRNREIGEKNAIAKTILSQLNLLYDEKTELLKEKTYSNKYDIGSELLFYNVHSYIHQICLNLRSTVAKLIKEDTEYVDVSLIYKYSTESQWKWIAGKSGASGAEELNNFVKKEDTLFNFLLTNADESPIFCNMKEKLIENKHYHEGRRDRLFRNKGSVMAMILTHFNNEKELINAILIISTYGVRFVPIDENDGKEIDKFKRILIYEVLPYYISLFQSEMGAMYLRHINKK